MNVKTLAAPLAMSQPAVTKHVNALVRAGLAERRKHGRESLIELNALGLKAVSAWIEPYAAPWRAKFEAMDAYIDQRNGAKS